MIDATTSAVLTGAIVVGGQWTQGKKLDGRTIIGGTFYAILITVVSEFNTDIGDTLAVAVLVTALFAYGPALVKGVGLDK